MSSSIVQRGLPTADPETHVEQQVEDIMTQLQILWPRWVRNRDLDRVAPNPDANFIAEMQSLRAAINRLEDRLFVMTYDSAYERIDQMLPPMSDMSLDAQRSGIHTMIDERKKLLEEMDNEFDLDLDRPSLFPPHLEFYRIIAEKAVLEDYIIDEDTEDLPRDQESNRIAIETAMLESLPVVPLNELADESDCNICMEPYVTGCGSNVVRLPCGHLFGSKCLSTWLSSGAATCPMCRAVVIKEQPNSQFAPPRPGRLAEWRGAADFLNYIDDLYIIHDILEEEAEDHPGQLMLFVDTADGPDEASNMSIAPSPDELSFARMVLKLSRLFFTAGERDQEAAAGLAAMMGRLYESLREPMRMACCPVLWTETGPPVSLLIDPAVVPFVEFALERLVQVEAGDLARRTEAAQ